MKRNTKTPNNNTRNNLPTKKPRASAAELYIYGVEIAIVVLLAVWILYAYFYEHIIDVCWADRTKNPKDIYFTLTTNILFFTSVCTMILCFIQLAIWNPEASKSKVSHSFTTENLFSIFTTLVWFLVTYAVCLLGKEILDDKNCSHTKNSVSGHYTFHVYYFLTLPYVYLSIKTYQAVDFVPPKSSVKGAGWYFKYQEMILIITFAVFAISTSTTLIRTLLYGYHSVRQIFYGAFLAVVSHYFSVVCRPTFIQHPLKATAGLSFILAFSIYNHTSTYGPFPLYTYEKVAYGLAWAGMVRYAWALSSLSKLKTQ